MALGPELIAAFVTGGAPAAGTAGWRCNGGKTGAGVVVVNLVEPVNVNKDLLIATINGTLIPEGSITVAAAINGASLTVTTADNANNPTDSGFSLMVYRVQPYAQ